ncbi:hypothetical protein PILCRDRAFT_14048 [Piloderma croceum F 1598]|uniref:Uncharacterized protein n=1 Tax=Piloderma croceum (strain F 1598) TaxID=765440 RepID=A0A0C3EQL0_PILCF|nr:hypothetical protein PILCRDRAFT_14048 [Piloderma croceum F 1598]
MASNLPWICHRLDDFRRDLNDMGIVEINLDGIYSADVPQSLPLLGTASIHRPRARWKIPLLRRIARGAFLIAQRVLVFPADYVQLLADIVPYTGGYRQRYSLSMSEIRLDSLLQCQPTLKVINVNARGRNGAGRATSEPFALEVKYGNAETGYIRKIEDRLF